MEEPTKYQEEILNKFGGNCYGWKFPCCNSEVSISPNIENPGEDNTQIYCLYGCGFIFLEHYLENKK